MTPVRGCHPETCLDLHVCSKCKEPKACSMFYRRKSQKPGGRDRRGERVASCKTCQNKRRVADRSPETQRKYMLTWRYGLTQEGFQALLESQGGSCAIEACPATEPGGKGTWHVDHDHSCCPGVRSCGKCIRGLLCSRCNTALGLFDDNPETMRSAASYVER